MQEPLPTNNNPLASLASASESATISDTPTVAENKNTKRPRTEAQLAVTKKMQAARKEKQQDRKNPSTTSFDSPATPNNVAMADIWYSNHELSKDKRRKQKKQDMEELVDQRFGQFHTKLVDELQKPLAGFLDQYLDQYWEFVSDDDDEEKNTITNNKEKEPLAKEKAVAPAPVPAPEEREVSSSTSSKPRIIHSLRPPPFGRGRSAPIDIKGNGNGKAKDFSKFF